MIDIPRVEPKPVPYAVPSSSRFPVGGLRLDGSTVFVNVGNPVSLQLTGAMTVIAWSRLLSGNSGKIISKHGLATNRGWELGYSGTYRFTIATAAAASLDVNGSAQYSHVVNEWAHVAGVFVPSTALRVYKNGLQIGELTIGIPALQRNSTLNVNVGRRPSAVSYLPATVAEVRVYNRALTQSEIYSDYVGDVSRTGLVLEHLYRQWHARDTSPSANHGIVSGGLWE